MCWSNCVWILLLITKFTQNLDSNVTFSLRGLETPIIADTQQVSTIAIFGLDLWTIDIATSRRPMGLIMSKFQKWQEKKKEEMPIDHAARATGESFDSAHSEGRGKGARARGHIGYL